MKIAQFLNSKNSGRKIKMFVAQEYLSSKSAVARNGGKDFVWRAYFDKKSFSFLVQEDAIKEDFVEIVSVNEYQHDPRELSLTLKYRGEIFEHYEPLYSLTPHRIELDEHGKITASYFTTFNDCGSKDRYKNIIEWIDKDETAKCLTSWDGWQSDGGHCEYKF